MKSLLKYAAFALVAGLLLFGFDALAAENNAFTHAANLMTTTFKNVRMIVYIFGAFALIAVAIGAIMGKLDFKKVAFLAVGLAIVAAADLIVKYAIQNDVADQSSGYGYDKFELTN